MEPSKVDRLNLLFDGEDRPPLPDGTKPHVADQDLIHASGSEWQKSNIPSTASYPRTIPKAEPPPENRRDIELVSSSDDDDEYVASFKAKSRPKLDLTKASNTKQKNKRRKGKNSPSPTMEKSNDQRKVDSARSRSSSTSSIYSEHGVLTGSYCPIILASKFPYKYLRAETSDKVAKRFFDEGKFWRRSWQVYYIHPPAFTSSKALMLIPESQVQDFLDEINQVFKCSLATPSDPDLGFVLSFFNNGTPQPIYLGVSKSRSEFGEMEFGVPAPDDGYGKSPPGASRELDRSFAAWRVKMERSVQATKNKSVALKKKKTATRILQQQDWSRSLRRGQRYLGLRPRAQRVEKIPGVDADQSVERQEAAQRERELLENDNFSILQPAPHTFDSGVVFVSIDVESYERDHRQVTEIGVSTLDTRDIVNVAPGENGKSWRTHIRSRHFRIAERGYLVNKDFVNGCPDKFMFGDSEWVSLQAAPEVVDRCFQPPFSSAFRHDGTEVPNPDADKAGVRQEPELSLAEREPVDTNGPSNESQAIANKIAVQNVISRSQGKVLTPDVQDEVSAIIEDLELKGKAIEEPALRSEKVSPGAHSNKVSTHMSANLQSPGEQSRGDFTTFQGSKSNISEEGEIRDMPRAEPVPYEARQIVLVGHDTQTDISYLRRLGCAAFDKEGEILPNMLEALDTATLYRVYKREMTTRSLGNLLLEFEIGGWYLHNAGNDARYTLEVMLAILLRARQQESETLKNSKDFAENTGTEKAWEGEVRRRVEASVKEAEIRVREECESWLIATGAQKPASIKDKLPVNEEEAKIKFTEDDIDGGEPIGIDVEPSKRRTQESKDHAQLDEWRKEGKVFASNGEGLTPDAV